MKNNRNKIDEGALPRKHNMDQMNKLQRTIDASGGDIEKKVRTTSQSKEFKMPNAMYMDNPLTSKRKISTYETFTKTDNMVKTTAAKSTEPKGKKGMRKFEQYKIESENKTNEEFFYWGGNYENGIHKVKQGTDGSDNNGKNYDIKKGDDLTILNYDDKTKVYSVEYNDKKYELPYEIVEYLLDRKFRVEEPKTDEKLKFSDGEEFETSGELRKEERKDGWYVLGQGKLIPVKDEAEADKYIDKHKKTNEGRIPYRDENESRIESHPSDDLKANFRSWEYDHDNEDDAKGLFDILCERHPDFDKDELEEMAYHWVGLETPNEISHKRDYVYHGRSESPYNESKKSDDKNYVEYKGKIGDRYVDKDGNEFVVRGKVKGGVTIKGQGGEKEIDTNSLLKMKKLNESKKSDEKHITTKIDNWIQNLDTDVRGTMEDKLRPMFVNRPNNEIRPSYDILRAGKTIHIDGQDCSIIGLKNGKLLVDFINKEHKHDVIELSMKDALKYMKKSKKDKEE